MRSGFVGVRAVRLAFFEPVACQLVVPPRVPFETVRGSLGRPGAFRAAPAALRERLAR